MGLLLDGLPLDVFLLDELSPQLKSPSKLSGT